MTMTLDERLDHARAAITAYFSAKGETERASDADYEETDVSDLIADLLHLQAHLGLKDEQATLSTALMHYEAEQADYIEEVRSAILASHAFDSAALNPHIDAVEFSQEAAIAELVDALRDLLGDLPNVQNGKCGHCGRIYEEDLTGDCPSDDCPSFRARAVLAKVNGVCRLTS